MGNLKAAEEKCDQVCDKLADFKNEQHISNDEKKKKKIKGIEADILGHLGSLYENMGNLPKADKFYLSSLKIM